jgi:hypothetical protein
MTIPQIRAAGASEKDYALYLERKLCDALTLLEQARDMAATMTGPFAEMPDQRLSRSLPHNALW